MAALENSEFAAELDGIDVVGRSAGQSDDLRLRGLGLEDEGGKVRRPERMPYRAKYFAAVLLDHLRGVVLQRISEGVIGGEEKPSIAAALDHLPRGADGERVGVEHPLHGVGRAEFAVKVGRSRGMGYEELLLFIGDALHRQADGGDRHVDDQVDLVTIVPLPGDAGRDVGFELMVGGNHRDRFAQHLAAEIVGRHLRRGHRTGAGRRRRRTGQVGENPDLHNVVRNLCFGEAARKDNERGEANEPNSLHQDPPGFCRVGS